MRIVIVAVSFLATVAPSARAEPAGHGSGTLEVRTGYTETPQYRLRSDYLDLVAHWRHCLTRSVELEVKVASMREHWTLFGEGADDDTEGDTSLVAPSEIIVWKAWRYWSGMTAVRFPGYRLGYGGRGSALTRNWVRHYPGVSIGAAAQGTAASRFFGRAAASVGLEEGVGELDVKPVLRVQLDGSIRVFREVSATALFVVEGEYMRGALGVEYAHPRLLIGLRVYMPRTIGVNEERVVEYGMEAGLRY